MFVGNNHSSKWSLFLSINIHNTIPETWNNPSRNGVEFVKLNTKSVAINGSIYNMNAYTVIKIIRFMIPFFFGIKIVIQQKH